MQQSSSKREIYSDTSLSQKWRKISNEQPIFTKKPRERRTNKIQRSEQKNHKI